ncbi:aspartate/glutamate racemase family protein [Siccirubricoccus sp. KC 17139]|uniref:Aspartate/glutamate racemase family protein n=1 Tax=Siccirubricoccus soli TaxID=2899147 RepID=A0ABT1DAK6_9PROT|nr:aspartate/glutamate racemase family protein [Siccirubricoccus soli]MCO6418978.1 aspartate/glutamate racemase family protein [Siccirubricoccus soli]MCP2685113.1 aspartate/glutamate racemase family protein [Siccirubricoccus soli]
MIRLGMLTPSSNTVLEPLTAEMLRGLPGVTAHFARFRVLAINLGEAASAQFDPAPVIAAAELLADAKVHAICWNGTSGAWLGLEQDRALCAAITAATGIPATTATLSLMDAFAALGAKRIGLVTPYLAEVQRAILARFAASGLTCVAERHLEDPGNYSFAEHPAPKVDALVREVAAAGPEAIAIHCTNFRGGLGAPALEAALGIPVLDSVAVSLWGSLRAAGADPRPLLPRGRVFGLGGPRTELSHKS